MNYTILASTKLYSIWITKIKKNKKGKKSTFYNYNLNYKEKLGHEAFELQ